MLTADLSTNVCWSKIVFSSNFVLTNNPLSSWLFSSVSVNSSVLVYSRVKSVWALFTIGLSRMLWGGLRVPGSLQNVCLCTSWGRAHGIHDTIGRASMFLLYFSSIWMFSPQLPFAFIILATLPSFYNCLFNFGLKYPPSGSTADINAICSSFCFIQGDKGPGCSGLNTVGYLSTLNIFYWLFNFQVTLELLHHIKI